MNINDEKLFSLETKIEEVRRRKLADYKQKDFSYIDTDNNLDKLKIYNNNIIEARRGCGKTSIILKALEETKELSVQCDCQIYRNKEKRYCCLGYFEGTGCRGKGINTDRRNVRICK